MKFFKALLFVAFLSFFAHGENSEVKPLKEGDGLFAMLSSNVAKIIVSGNGLYSTLTNAQGRIIARESILNVLFIIDCPTNIESAITALYPIAEEPASITFSGMLSMQYFVDRNDRLLAQAHIYCNGGTVSVRTNASLIRIGNEYKVITPYLSYKGDEGKKIFINMRRVNYARVIYNLMKQHAPQEIQRFNDLNKKLGRNLEEDLGFE